MAVEELFVGLLSSLLQPNSTLNLILIVLVFFLLQQANRYVVEHRDMRQRLTELESKINAYENLGVIQRLYLEQREKRGERHAGKPATNAKQQP